MADETSSHVRLRQALELVGSHFVNLVEIGILKTFIDHGVFDRIPEQGSIALVELSPPGSDELALLERFTTYLVASEILASPAEGLVAHTPRSMSYRTGQIPAGFVVHVFNFLLRPVAQWPLYFERNGLKAPQIANNIPLGLATGHPDSNLYGILDKEPALAKQFNGAMAGSGKIYSLNGVYNFHWVTDLLVGDRHAIVDVGGGTGVALQDIIRDNDFIPPSKCAVLDLATVVEHGNESNRESRMPRLVGGSMFEPYPKHLHNSVVYMFRRVLNDFPDDDVVKALVQARAACAPDSRILIIEELLHANRSKFSIAQDIFVMNFGGKRRSEDMFRILASKAGFRVNSVIEDIVSDFGVVELVLDA